MLCSLQELHTAMTTTAHICQKRVKLFYTIPHLQPAAAQA
jgi:hypothetical protein